VTDGNTSSVKKIFGFGKSPSPEKDSYERTAQVVAIFLAVVSLLTVYSNTVGGDYSGAASSQTAEATRHMLNATDWWSYYQAHRLRITVYSTAFMAAYASDNSTFGSENMSGIFSKLDNYDALMAANNGSVRDLFLQNLSAMPPSSMTKAQLLDEYLKGIEKSVSKAQDGSAAATHEEQEFARLMDLSSKNGAYGSKYGFVTTMLIVAVTLGGIANITKRKMLAYACMTIGIFAILNLALLAFAPGILGLPVPPP